MPPIARSLLAITALLVAINGKVIDVNENPGSLCNEINIVLGSTLNADNLVEVSFNFKSYEDIELHKIEDHCKEMGLYPLEQTVRACNGYKLPSAPNWFPPEMHDPGYKISPVFASCRKNPECLPIEFHVTQTCVKVK